jgi:hypothetical protein
MTCCDESRVPADRQRRHWSTVFHLGTRKFRQFFATRRIENKNLRDGFRTVAFVASYGGPRTV